VTEEVRELTALYALGVLTQHEARSFEIHLREGCPFCKSELSRCERTAAGIGLTAEEIETPEYVRDLLLARIEREPPVPVAADLSRPSEPTVNISSPVEEPGPAPKRHRSMLAWGIWIAFVALVIVNLWALNSLRSTRESKAKLQDQLSVSQAAEDNLQKKLDSRKEEPGDLEQILEIVANPGVRIARLVGQPPAPSSSGTIFWDAKEYQYLLMGSFPPAPQGKAYQLWLVKPARKVSAGLIRTNPNGPTLISATTTEDASDADAVGITLEPDSGSPMPTTRFYVLGRFN
jgi:anti-sigma-K factor RskA